MAVALHRMWVDGTDLEPVVADQGVLGAVGVGPVAGPAIVARVRGRVTGSSSDHEENHGPARDKAQDGVDR
jgi:hypothetical protein